MPWKFVYDLTFHEVLQSKVCKPKVADKLPRYQKYTI